VALTELVRADWQLGARLLTEALYPDAERDALNAQAEMRRSACTGEMAAALLELSSRTDIREELGAILAPTLVMHRTEDQMVPFRARPRPRGAPPGPPAGEARRALAPAVVRRRGRRLRRRRSLSRRSAPTAGHRRAVRAGRADRTRDGGAAARRRWP